MTASVGNLSTAVIAVIAVGGVAVLLAAITITAWCCALPARLRRRKAGLDGGNTGPDMDEVDVEKNAPTVSVTVVDSQAASQINKSGQATRAPSSECQCEHPSPASPRIIIQPPPPSYS
jgi:hypothetical protein